LDEIFTLLGKIALSLFGAIVDAFTCLLEEKVRRYLLDACFLVMWWNILDKEGFFMLSLELGKEFMQLCCFFLVLRLICLNPWMV